MSDGHAGLDAHAYVDNCLNPPDRASFEAALRRDAKLRARVEAWEAQNEAIRLAFGAAPRPRVAPAVGRPSNENTAGAKAEPARAEPAPRAPPTPSAPPRPPSRGRVAAIGGLALLAVLATSPGGPSDPREAIMARADAALRAGAVFADGRLDFTSDNPRAVSAWLAPRFARLSPERLAPPGWSLLGVRVVPGLASAAAFVVYEDALGGRAGLLLEQMDVAELPPIDSHDSDETIVAGAESGFAYAAVGPTRSGVGALAPAPRAD